MENKLEPDMARTDCNEPYSREGTGKARIIAYAARMELVG